MENLTLSDIINYVVYPACAIFSTVCLYVIVDTLEKNLKR